MIGTDDLLFAAILSWYVGISIKEMIDGDFDTGDD